MRHCLAVALLALAWGAFNAPISLAGESLPHWQVQALAKPYNFGTLGSTSPQYEVVLTNVGGAPSLTPTEVELELPTGVTAVNEESHVNNWVCPEAPGGSFPAGTSIVKCSTIGLPEFAYKNKLLVRVAVTGGAPEALVGSAKVSGGGGQTVEKEFANPRTAVSPVFHLLEVTSFATDALGEPAIAAAGHPNLFNVGFTTPAATAPDENFGGVESAKDIVLDLPPGAFANPTAAGSCSVTAFFANAEPECPSGSQVGVFSVSGNGGVAQEGEGYIRDQNPIFNLTPERGYPAELGFWDQELFLGVVAQGELVHTNQGYVVRVVVPNAAKGIYGPYYLQSSVFGNPEKEGLSRGGGRPFFTNPATCTGEPLKTTIHVDTWGNPAPVGLKPSGAPAFESANFADPRWHSAVAEAPAVTGCEALQFRPSIKLSPDTTSADSPSGLDVSLSVPQDESPEGLATPPLRKAEVVLPQGLVVNPSVAGGLSGCTEAQVAPDSTRPGDCPDSSKIGTATLHTPPIDHALEGSLYVGEPECSPCSDGDGAAGRLIKLYIEINDPATGVVVKLPGNVLTEPGTGRLKAVFKANPQLPFENLDLHMKSGPRAPLTTPLTCGQYTTTTDLEPWSAPQSGPNAKPQSRFNVNSGANGTGCPSSEAAMPNSPTFEAGTAVPLAATYSPFILKVTRDNGSQRIAGIDTRLPAGLVGKLAGIPYCPDAAIAAAPHKSGRAEQASPSCSSASEVGVVNVGAGSGAPFYVQGHAYLAGPYKGAPLSLEIITPAVAGPFDLGTVAVRSALYVEPYTAQIHAVSDPIPSMLAGVPLDVRSIALNMNRAQFTLNPTSCNPMKVLGGAISTLGQPISLQSRFQVGGCKGLNFTPSLKVSVKGSTKRAGHPALKAVVTYPKGGSYANIARAQVGLPHSEFLDQGNLDKVCKQAELNSGTCPKRSIYGKAKAWSPLLDKPLEGPVYLGVGFGYKLPALVAELNGQVRILLKGKVDTTKQHGIRNTFEAVPDAPVSRFVLEMKGGKKYGLLDNSENLCHKPQRASALFTAQNGVMLRLQPKITNDCKRHHDHARHQKSDHG
jgi:hypothetical protein